MLSTQVPPATPRPLLLAASLSENSAPWLLHLRSKPFQGTYCNDARSQLRTSPFRVVSMLMRSASIHIARLLAICVIASPAFAQKDEMSIATGDSCTVANAGATVVLPLYVRDVSRSPLGTDQPPGKRIQGISFQILYSPVEATSQVRLFRAGVIANLTPITEFSPTTRDGVAYIGLFDERVNPIPFRVDVAEPGDVVMELRVTLQGNAAPGTIVNFVFGPSTTTALTDQGGVTSETVDNGWLAVKGTCIRVGTPRRRAVQRP